MDFTYQQFQSQYYNGNPMIDPFDHSKWLLQQPRDSGYNSDENDLFAQAFNAHQPVQMIKCLSSASDAATTPPLCHNASSVASQDSPFQYADSLCVPSEQWQPYDTASYPTFMFNGGMETMPALYNNLESMLPACDPTFNLQAYPQAQQQLVQSPSSITPSNTLPMVQEPASPHGQASQRLPHTAVEQRYRRNLNLQFGKLRQAVPDIQTSQPQRGGNPAKPSKCEVLMGACDYIKQLEEENRRLKEATAGSTNTQRKRARVE